MSLLTLGLGLLIPGGIVGAVLKFGAGAVFGGLGKAVKGVAGWAAAHWQLTLALVAIGAAVFYGLHQRQEARHQAKLAANFEGLYHGEQAAHAITLRSLAGAKAEIADNNRRIAAAAAELAREQAEWARDKATLEQRWHHTAATIAALEADARRTDTDPCTVSDEAKRALEDM